MLKKTFMAALAAVFILGGAAYAADTVGLVDSQKIMFQHPRFDEVTKILLFLSKPLEGSAMQIMQAEPDLERKQMIMTYSTQVTEFADVDRVIAAEPDPEKKNALWEERQQKFSAFEATLMEPIMQECSEAIQAVMALKQMTVLIELDSVYYGGIDITEDVVQHLKRGR